MRKLLKYLKHYKKESIIGPLFKLLEACFELTVPIIMARMIDVGIKNQNMPFVWKMGAVLVAFGVLGLVCSLTAQYFAAKAAVGFGTELREDFFRHIGTLSYRELDMAGNATLVTRMTSDINQVQSGVNLVLRLFLRSPFIVVGAMAMAFTISVKLALIFVVAVPILSVVIYGIMIWTIPLYRKVQKKLEKIMLMTRENLSGVRVVRAFRTQEREKEEFCQETKNLMHMQTFVGKISALLNPVTYLIVNGATILIVWLGGKEVYYGNLSQGEVVALVNYMSQILLALVALANLIITFTKALASAERINEVFALQSSIQRGTEEEGGSSEMQIELENVSMLYHGDKETVLEDITLSVKKGETVGIIGGTGSGKTTLINLLPRFYDVTSGNVRIDGKNVKESDLDILREKFGIVPQKAVLFHGTIRDNMLLGNENASDEEIWEALRIAQADSVVKEKEKELDTVIQEGGKNLSGGQKQRLTIARALVRKPEILILDDSTSALDFATDAKLRRAIAENTNAMTVCIVSQRVMSMMKADKIFVLDKGKLVGSGTHEELLKTCEVYKEICSSQLSKEEVARHA
ncbi:MAG: ABC transporter ATP-binding protein [Lachnospiraceae bacterium]|nr:ABC transporter ATP-binding protein [Lachnospiraceae bacterium]